MAAEPKPGEPYVSVDEVGFRPERGGLHLASPLVLERGSALLTIRYLVSSSQAGTELFLEIAGIERREGMDPESPGAARVMLRDDQGRQYARAERSWLSTGEVRTGGAQTVTRHAMTFEQLDPRTRHVELEVEWGLERWRTAVDVVPFDRHARGIGTGASASARDITLRLRRAIFAPDRTAFEFDVIGGPEVRFVRGIGAFMSQRDGDARLVLRDGRGRSYEEVSGPRRGAGSGELAVFGPVADDTRHLDLIVPYVVIEEATGSVDIELPLSAPTHFAFGDHQIRVMSARSVTRPAPSSASYPWTGIALEVDFGPWREGRRVLIPGRVLADGSDHGFRFGPLPPNLSDAVQTIEVTVVDPDEVRRITFLYPTVQVHGPWTVGLERPTTG